MTKLPDPHRRSGGGPVKRALVVAGAFLGDLQYWIGEDPRLALRILRLVLDVARDPTSGIGKPEPLRHDRSGDWSRRIDLKHRLLYRFDRQTIEFVSARFHYSG